MNNFRVEAYQVAESFNIKKLRAEFKADLNEGNTSELFYFFEDAGRYLYIFDYGVVVFGHYEEVAKSEFLRFSKNFAEGWLERTDIDETYEVVIDPKINRSVVKNDNVAVHDINAFNVRIIMLNIGQSVALEYYEMQTEEMLNSTKKITSELALNGKLTVPKTKLLKFIGGVLNVKNSIVDNLYILDDPNLVWEDEALNQLNRNLKLNFDTYARFKDLDYRLQIVENNLRLFTDLLNQREGKFLEWIVIILIFVEIMNSFFFRK